MVKYRFEYRTLMGKIRPTIKKWRAKMNEEMKTASDLVKDPSSFSALTYAWYITLAMLGGLVRVVRELRYGEKTKWQIFRIFLAEILTSIFVGLITFFLCEASGVRPLYTAVLTSTAGWMGVRALAVIEALYRSRITPPGV